MYATLLPFLWLGGCGPITLDVVDSQAGTDGDADTDTDADSDTDSDSDSDSDSDPPRDGDAVLNEMLSLSTDGSPDWVELYNGGDLEMHLDGWGITDHYGAVAPYIFEPGTTIYANDYLVLLADGENRVGQNIHLSFRLAVAGETLTLIDQNGKIHDEIAFPELEAGRSWAAVPDGGSHWETTRPTPGTSNNP